MLLAIIINYYTAVRHYGRSDSLASC